MKAKLNFPVIKGDPMPPPVLSMDQYADFVDFMRLHILDEKDWERQKENRRMRTPFRLI